MNLAEKIEKMYRVLTDREGRDVYWDSMVEEEPSSELYWEVRRRLEEDPHVRVVDHLSGEFAIWVREV